MISNVHYSFSSQTMYFSSFILGSDYAKLAQHDIGDITITHIR
jgi:hypothetical protein